MKKHATERIADEVDVELEEIIAAIEENENDDEHEDIYRVIYNVWHDPPHHEVIYCGTSRTLARIAYHSSVDRCFDKYRDISVEIIRDAGDAAFESDHREELEYHAG